MASCAQSQGPVFPGLELIASDVELSFRPLDILTMPPSLQMYKFDSPGLGDESQFQWGDEACDSVLDVLVTAETCQTEEPNPLYNLDLYKVSWYAC